MPHLPAISMDAADAFTGGYSFRRGNTMVDPPILQLHGHTIATMHDRDDRQILITVAGHPTRTTCSRLNAILQRLAIPASVHVSRGSALFRVGVMMSRHEGYPFLSSDSTYLVGPRGIQGP